MLCYHTREVTMADHKALLIQDISDFTWTVLDTVRPYLGHYSLAGYSEEDFLKWIIEEELELVYHLFAIGHIHNRMPHSEIYAIAREKTPVSLSKLVTYYIKAPMLFEDNRSVTICLNRNDLEIYYHSDRQRLTFL